MGRLWICLPLCLLLQDQNPLPSNVSGTADLGKPPPPDPEMRRRLEIGRTVGGMAAITPLGFPAVLSWASLRTMSDHLVPRHVRIGIDVAAGLGACAAAGPSWGPLRETLVRHGDSLIEDVCYASPMKFLEMILRRYECEVEGYTCTLYRRERIKGKLHELEVTDVRFRESPFSVFMKWKQGMRALGPEAALYVEGENNDKLLARPYGRLLNLVVVTKDVDGEEAKNSGRYTLKQFGIGLGSKRTLAAMRKADERGALYVRYYGKVNVPQLGDRLCYKFIRTPYEPVEEEGVNELTIYIDVETWLQTGSVLRDCNGQLLAEYFFRDVRLNPTFGPKDFHRSAL